MRDGKNVRSLKEAASTFLTSGEMALFRRSFDTIGDIAVIEVPVELEKHEKKIAQSLLELNKQIKVVVKKVGGHKGVFRVQKYKVLAGQRRKTTIYRESGVLLKLHLEHSYFSPRFGTERLRIAKLVQPGEAVLVMFSGIAPFNCVIAKNSKASSVYGVEINPRAHQLAVENVRMNKVENRCPLFCGDVRAVVPTIDKKFDRIAMPLPKGGEDFLDVALTAAKEGATIHFYDFLPENEFDKAKEKAIEACKRQGKHCRILGLQVCGQQSPRVYRICVDFQVTKK